MFSVTWIHYYIFTAVFLIIVFQQAFMTKLFAKQNLSHFSNNTLKCIQKYELKTIYIKEKIFMIDYFKFYEKYHTHTHTHKCYIEYWKPVQVHLLERPFKQNHTYFTILRLCLNAFGYISQTDPLIAHIRDLLGSTLILKNLHIVFFLY